jgi:hypothetical protein
MGRQLTKLYEFLMERQRSGRPFALDDAIAATGYEETSLKTNISKHLKGRWVEPVDGRLFRVKGFEGVSSAVFAAAMSQNTRFAFASEHEWREQLRRLLGLGVQHGYQVRGAVDEVLRELGKDGG